MGKRDEPDKRAHDRAGAMGHLFRLAVLTALFHRPASAIEIAEELDVPADRVRYQLKRLLADRLIEIAAERQRRGTVERLYVTVEAEMLLNHGEFAGLPEELRRNVDARLVKLIFGEALRSLSSGRLTAREDSAIIRTPMIVDEQGWAQLAVIQIEALERMQAVREESRARLVSGEGASVRASAVLMLFEMPEPGSQGP